MKTVVAACVLAWFSAGAFAQNPTPGLPPITTNRPVEQQPAPAPDKAAQAPGKEQALAEAERAAALLALVEKGIPAGENNKLTPKVAPPPPDMTIEPGKTVRMPIAIGALNRIHTPFPDPVAKHGESVAVETQGSVLYVASNVSAPQALFIAQRGEDDRAIVLTVLPSAGIDPVSVNLRLAGYEAREQQPSPAQAAQFEAAQPYVDTLKVLFRDLAQGHVPQGYGLTDIKGASAWMPHCAMPGISIAPKQELEGAGLVTIVARAVNVGRNTTELNESACNAPGVLAVAAWPSVRLAPGEEAELYIAVRRPDDAGLSRRPSTLTGG